MMGPSAEIPATESLDSRDNARCLAAYAPLHQRPRPGEYQQRDHPQDRERLTQVSIRRREQVFPGYPDQDVQPGFGEFGQRADRPDP